MEAAGLAVGVFALVGVFEDCITLLSQVATANSITQDYTRLETKLDFQKLFLLQWADRLNLFSVRYDRRLDDPSIGSMVKRGLHCIRDLFMNTEELQRLYGVRDVLENEETTSFSAVSDRLMRSFRQNSAALRFRQQSMPPKSLNAKERQKGYSNFAKVRWVVRDKEKFESLIRELSDLIANLEKVVPPPGGKISARTALKDEVRGLHNIDVLRRVLDASTDENVRLAEVTEDAITEECYRLILDRLWFRLIEDRENSIAEEHPETLEWAIHPPSGRRAWSDLSKWLRQDHGIYWISGKPGSGKSTLMKYLLKHPDVMVMLNEWAGNRALNVAAFFVWNIGSSEQSSLAGLTRGLLYHILLQDRSLIPMILPGMWREVQSGVTRLNLPSQSETNEAFRRLGNEVKGTVYAFFIDGIDEFTGSHRDCTAFIQELRRSPNMKLVVSSRPLDACEAAFSSDPKLALQDLTERDIDKYITDHIGSHQYVIKKMVDGVIVGQLINDLKKKAEGVFLWIVLACRMLVEGFQAHDNAAELRSRVEQLPQELEDLFLHILGKIPSRFLDHTAKFLKLCWVNRKHTMGRESFFGRGISALGLSWADENDFEIDALGNFKGWSVEEMERKCSILEGRLTSRCMGLLEIHGVVPNHKPARHDVHMFPTVEFMHRTVFEFLETPGVWELKYLSIRDQAFDATIVLTYMSAQILYIQTYIPNVKDRFGCQCFGYLRILQDSVPGNFITALERLTNALIHIPHKDGKPVWSRFFSHRVKFGVGENDLYHSCSITEIKDIEIQKSSPNKPLSPDEGHFPLNYSTLLLAIECNFTSYVLARFSNASKRIQTQYLYPLLRYPLLYHAIEYPLLSSLSRVRDDWSDNRIQFVVAQPSWNDEVVQLMCALLHNGCDPNEEFTDKEGTCTTPWRVWLRHIACIIFPEHNITSIHFAKITSMMLQAGAKVKLPDLEGVGTSDARECQAILMRMNDIWLRSTTNLWGIDREADRIKLIDICNEITQAIA